MDNTKNALAELAERLSAIIDGCYNESNPNHRAIHKAQRIVAELAKLKYNKDGEAWSIDDAYETVTECRAIAGDAR